MTYIDGLPYLGTNPSQQNLEMVIAAHKAANSDVGGKKGLNKNGNVKVSGVNIPLLQFYTSCVAVAVENGSWKEVCSLLHARLPLATVAHQPETAHVTALLDPVVVSCLPHVLSLL
ncbi:MAG: hypothetical protein ACKPB4_22045 [Sphaerospermopsis kisseleviana]